MRTALLAAFASLALASAAYAHPATEQYIPIGQSPGPGVVSGTAGAVAEPASGEGDPIVSVESAAGAEVGAYVVTEQTRVYIDRSAQGLPRLVGSIDDVQPGRVIEVRIADPDTREAEWIKVRP
jgi:hypothetical protein